MLTYQYNAVDKTGGPIRGKLAAVNEVDLELRLQRMGLDLITARKVNEPMHLGRGSITRQDLITFCFHMEQLSRAGIPFLPRIIGDQAQLKQALLNLLVNAMDASGEGDTVTVTSGAAAGGVAVAVRDTGAGTPEGELEKIFKPFYTTKTRGAGLGLAIVERIVKAHQGEIAVTRNKERGTTFTMTLPVDTHADR